MRMHHIATAAAAAMLGTGSANAAVFIVDAQANSSSGGTPVATFAVTLGEQITVDSSINDLWSAGALPRFSDGNGLTAIRLATAADDSGQAPGTQIGADFGLWNQFGIDAPFGSLVGEIDGVFQLLGANALTAAWNTGTLNLWYWDSNNEDNFGQIAFDVNVINVIPEPATWAMLIAGFGLVGAGMRRRARRVAVLA